MEKLTWVSKLVDTSAIDPTPKNYKIKTQLGKARLLESLKQFGLAGNCVVNYHPSKKGRYVLIDGNSRLDEAKAKKTKQLWVSMPNRALTPKEFKLMSAMFDFAKAGEVDVEEIKKDHGTSSDFFKAWQMEIPMHALDKIGKKGKVVLPKVKAGSKTTGGDVQGTSATVMVNLFLSQSQHKKFRKQEEKLAKKYKTDNTTETVYKKFMQ